MKKLLAMLGAAGLVVSTSAVLVSCGGDKGTDVKTVEIEFKDVVFSGKAKKDTAKLTEVKLGDKAVEGITLEDSTLSEDGMKLSGKLTVPVDLPAGNYVATITADADEAAFDDETRTVTATVNFTIKAKEDQKSFDAAIEPVIVAAKAANTNELAKAFTPAEVDGVKITPTVVEANTNADGSLTVKFEIEKDGKFDVEGIKAPADTVVVIAKLVENNKETQASFDAAIEPVIVAAKAANTNELANGFTPAEVDGVKITPTVVEATSAEEGSLTVKFEIEENGKFDVEGIIAPEDTVVVIAKLTEESLSFFYQAQ